MRIHCTVLSCLAIVAASAGAQVVYTVPGGTLAPSNVGTFTVDVPRAVIGLSTSGGTGSRDTLGLLVSTVVRNSPAEKAGIEEGNRIQAINGVNLRLSPQDLGDPDMERLMTRRLNRELDKLKVGDDVDLKVYVGGQARSIKVKTVEPDSLYNTTNRAPVWRSWEDRASLGLTLGATGSRRDTLGVFVIGVEEEGPAAKAGVEEGARVASINGVDLRVAREDAGDDLLASMKMSRLERELGKMKAGDVAELRIYQNGQSKTVKVTTVALGEMRMRSRVIGGGPFTIARSPSATTVSVDHQEVAAAARRAAEVAAATAARVIDGVSRSVGGGYTIRW